eukprot:13796724-Ditylum_brightwellii.AAC.1
MLQHEAGSTGQDGLSSDALNLGVNFLGTMAHCDQHENAGMNYMPAGAQGYIFHTKFLYTGAGNSAHVITAPACGGNVVQAVLNSPPVMNQGISVQKTSCMYDDCGMAHSEVHGSLHWFIDCHTRMNNNLTKSHKNQA